MGKNIHAFGPLALVLFTYIAWLIRKSDIRKAFPVTQQTHRCLSPRAEVDAAETKSRPTSKTENRFIGRSCHNPIIMESELTVSQNERM
jgi:hypothetical protein